jgi:hypothetical protein
MLILIIKTILTLFSVIVFQYFFWKKLKDDYSQYQIFTSGFYSLFGIAAGFIISHLYFPAYWFWCSLIGSISGLLIGRYRLRMKFFETLEAWIIGSLSIFLIYNIYDITGEPSLDRVIGMIAVILLIVLFFYINKRYKKYVWYRSGKVGFSGLLVAGLYFVFRASFSVFSGIMNKSAIPDAIASSIVAFVSFLTLYNLAKKEND